MYIISIATFKYSLDHYVSIVIVVIESNVVGNHINRNFVVFFIPQCLIIIGVMTSNVDVNQINNNFKCSLDHYVIIVIWVM